MPESAESRLVGPVTIEATDNLAVVAYLISESAAAPTATSPGWTPTKPTEFHFSGSGSGSLTAYAWVKDQAGNISQSRMATVVVTEPTTKTSCPP